MSVKGYTKRMLNVNVGVLGHVDSGKTSLVAALSTLLSTAALDKHPQSKERGITLDLGFSSFTVPMPPHLAHLPYDELQLTLVDCPGHASLIRTIIGGVQIIDMALLVVDVTKGLQTQTAECLVLAEVAAPRLLLALNKVDLLQPLEERPRAVRRAVKRLRPTLGLTRFAGAAMVAVAAAPGGSAAGSAALGIEELRAALVAAAAPAPRRTRAPLLLAVDHCFPLRGCGTVLTGTVLQGSVAVNDPLELPALKQVRPVKSLQVFRRPVARAAVGDRVGVGLTQLDAAQLERGLACAPGSVPTFAGAVAAVEKVRFYAGRVPSGAKFHVTVGHSTLMASLTCFGTPDGTGLPPAAALAAARSRLAGLGGAGEADVAGFDWDRDYWYQDELYGLEGRPLAEGAAAAAAATAASRVADNAPAAASGGVGKEGQAGQAAAERAEEEGEAEGELGGRHFGPQWVLLRFEQPVTAPRDALVIGAKFDADIHGEACRLAFYGRLVAPLDPACPAQLARLRVCKIWSRRGLLERLLPDGAGGIVSRLIKKDSDAAVFAGIKVLTGRGEEGVIESAFGKSGKLKVHFLGGLARGGRTPADNVVTLVCKRYLFDPAAKKVLWQ